LDRRPPGEKQPGTSIGAMGRTGIDTRFTRARGLVDELAQEVERFLAAGP